MTSYKKVTAILRSTVLEGVERRLETLGVHGMSVLRVRGFGEYANYFEQDMLVDRIRIDVYTTDEKAEVVASALVDVAHTGASGDGLVAVEPVDALWNVRTRRPVEPDVS